MNAGTSSCSVRRIWLDQTTSSNRHNMLCLIRSSNRGIQRKRASYWRVQRILKYQNIYHDTTFQYGTSINLTSHNYTKLLISYVNTVFKYAQNSASVIREGTIETKITNLVDDMPSKSLSKCQNLKQKWTKLIGQDYLKTHKNKRIFPLPVLKTMIFHVLLLVNTPPPPWLTPLTHSCIINSNSLCIYIYGFGFIQCRNWKRPYLKHSWWK